MKQSTKVQTISFQLKSRQYHLLEVGTFPIIYLFNSESSACLELFESHPLKSYIIISYQIHTFGLVIKKKLSVWSNQQFGLVNTFSFTLLRLTREVFYRYSSLTSPHFTPNILSWHALIPYRLAFLRLRQVYRLFGKLLLTCWSAIIENLSILFLMRLRCGLYLCSQLGDQKVLVLIDTRNLWTTVW